MASQVPNMAGTTEAAPAIRNFSWSGIFAGTFLFLAIEATFGTLGAAIFASASNPHAANPVGFGMTAGIGIWMVVLTAFSMYFAGRLSALISGARSRAEGLRSGLVTFGMSIFATILVIAITLGSTMGGTTGLSYAAPTSVANLLTVTGYWTFVTLIVAMITSASGGAHGARRSGPQRVMDRSNESSVAA